jgi:hypothetical protein
MTMRHIQAVEVTYDDDTTEKFEGRGVAHLVSTVAPADKDSGSPAREYTYLSLTLNLPLPEEEPEPE